MTTFSNIIIITHGRCRRLRGLCAGAGAGAGAGGNGIIIIIIFLARVTPQCDEDSDWNDHKG